MPGMRFQFNDKTVIDNDIGTKQILKLKIAITKNDALFFFRTMAVTPKFVGKAPTVDGFKETRTKIPVDSFCGIPHDPFEDNRFSIERMHSRPLLSGIRR